MSFKEMMQDDLDVFYNSEEFAESALYKGVEISVLFLEDMEVSDSSQKLITTKSSDVANIATGEIIVINTTQYEVLNFDFVDETKLERLLSLREV